MQSDRVIVRVDLERIRRNAADIAARTRTPIFATIKADAYGLGAARVAMTIREIVAGYCVFALHEAGAIDLWKLTARPTIALGPPTTLDPVEWRAAHVRPAVSSADQARTLRDARPILCIETGMQRFACPPADVAAAIEAGAIDEAFTHATRLEHVTLLRDITRGHALKLHAAATALLEEPAAWLDAVRPGFALYRGAVRVSTTLVEARRSLGPVGYTGWTSETGHHGVILAGYSHGLRPGPVLVNGRRQRITEIGMQSAYISTDPADRAGDEVVLLGDAIAEADLAYAHNSTPHAALLRMASMGRQES